MLKKHYFQLNFFILLCINHELFAEEISQLNSVEELVPGLLKRLPEQLLKITYDDKEVVAGEEWKPSDVNDAPEVSWKADPEKYYTLIMYDPDAPSRTNPSAADFKHWLVTNIEGSDIKTGNIIAEYYGSGPPKQTGYHRYIFVVYEQSVKMNFNEKYSKKLSRANRAKFSTQTFLDNHDLDKLIAANYFVAQWEPFVDERNKKITND